MLLSKAIEGFILHKGIEGLSPRTLELYQRQLSHLATFLGDPPLESVCTDDLRRFLHYLRHDYTPKRWDGDTSPLSPKSIRNYWIGLRSFYTWATADLEIPDALAPIPAPKAQEATVEPFTEEQIQKLLAAATTTKDGRQHPHAFRNRAIILTLLDTGLRAGELCSLTIGDYDDRTGRLRILGKGARRRLVYVGKVTRKGIWRYFAERDRRDDPDLPLFASRGNRHLSRSWLRKLLSLIGERAEVEDVYPHRFRHTFAIEYLRNRGDIFTLQRLLGHSSLQMVKRYLALADADAEQAHRRASPVDNLRL
jgi:integrase/recombinase XerD